MTRQTGPAADPDDGWQRLDERMLLIGPFDACGSSPSPLSSALVGISSSQGDFEPGC